VRGDDAGHVGPVTGGIDLTSSRRVVLRGIGREVEAGYDRSRKILVRSEDARIHDGNP